MNIFSRYITLFAIVVGLSLSGYVGKSFYDEETKAIEQDFRKDVDDKVGALEREILLNIEVLHAIKGLYDSSDEVSSREFHRIAQSFLVRHQDIQALEWVPKINANERFDYEKERRAEHSDFEITEFGEMGMFSAGDTEHYYPVSLIAPLAGNEMVLGYDLGSDPQRIVTMEKARDFDKPLATPSISLLQYSSEQQGFLIFLPTYFGEPTTLAKRRERLRGYVVGVYRIADMFGSAIKRTSALGIYYSLEDNSLDLGQAQKPEANHQANYPVLYSNFPRLNGLSPSQLNFTYTKPLRPFSGRQWSIVATPSSGYIAERRGQLPYTIAVFGGLFVLLSALYVYAIVRRAELIEREVKQRTADLNEAKRQLEELSHTDGLTKIPNRRCFDEKIELEWHKAIRDNTRIGLMMIDIDHFKLYNDSYGHLSGDQCLREVAQALSQTLNRDKDTVARYGGEEFVVILPDTRDCISPAKRCQYNIERLNLPHKMSTTSEFVTVSVGVTSTYPQKDSDIMDFISQADMALYEAKNTGRNKVNVYQNDEKGSTVSHLASATSLTASVSEVVNSD